MSDTGSTDDMPWPPDPFGSTLPKIAYRNTGHTVASLLAGVSECELLTALDRLYFDVPETAPYLEMRARLLTMIAKPTGMNCVLTQHSAKADDEPDAMAIDVSGQEMGSTVSYAIEFTPWPEWLGMLVLVAPDLELAPADLLAPILWEMSFLGFDETDIADFKEDLDDRVALIKDGTVELVPLCLPGDQDPSDEPKGDR